MLKKGFKFGFKIPNIKEERISKGIKRKKKKMNRNEKQASKN